MTMRVSRTVVGIGVCAALLASCYGYMRAITCHTESDRTIRDLSGLDFDIATTYCSTLVKTEHTKVYVSEKGRRDPKLIFEYDPIYWQRLPSISVPTTDRILITVPAVSSVVSRRHRWRGMWIDYDIGKIDDPGSETRLDDE
ncbi:MAG: hypothetical protein R3D62_01940 [Xanthobacteraceae bacterium]